MIITLDEARARIAGLPSDDDAALSVIDEQEEWLATRVGPLEGERTETFWVGVGVSNGKLALARYTDEVVVTDGDSVVDADTIRLIDNGSAFRLKYPNGWRAWTGPYVEATYTPNDFMNVRRVIFGLIALEAVPAGPFQSESMGDYSYTRPILGQTVAQQKAALVGSLIPRRPHLSTLRFGHLVQPHEVRL